MSNPKPDLDLTYPTLSTRVLAVNLRGKPYIEGTQRISISGTENVSHDPAVLNATRFAVTAGHIYAETDTGAYLIPNSSIDSIVLAKIEKKPEEKKPAAS